MGSYFLRKNSGSVLIISSRCLEFGGEVREILGPYWSMGTEH